MNEKMRSGICSCDSLLIMRKVLRIFITHDEVIVGGAPISVHLNINTNEQKCLWITSTLYMSNRTGHMSYQQGNFGGFPLNVFCR